MTIASRFMSEFGPTAFETREIGIKALQWMSDQDPHGNTILDRDAQIIRYAFTDRSTLIFDITTRLFVAPN